jgi:hypothetical protein
MTFSQWVRQVHRWLAIAFTLGVVANTVVIFGLKPNPVPFWVYLLALIPLWLLLPTGLYMFALPYVAGWRSRRRPATA